MSLLLWKLLFLVAAIQTILACEPVNQLLSKICQSDVVFRGRPVSGASGISQDEEGRESHHGRVTFELIGTFYRNMAEEAHLDATTLDVHRTYTAMDNCDPAFLPWGSDTYVVLASYDHVLTVPACGHVIPFECIPQDLVLTC
ncbi:hypothetical protein Bpfe_023015 [Biomphalaria pfeifferi]|uniref:Uncharacterized protein n=1 Tax=Biomphalaria pfeifferi TaxID=112525 RepID=A0AAD8B560_BIOPF|nr:hypothetical protein Bpfe_023015 [Biomphalaria pfeifferi]